MHLLGRHLDLEELDGYEALTLGIVAAKNGSESPSTNLMKHAKRAERIRSAVFRVQR
jgi:hypothetical protein